MDALARLLDGPRAKGAFLLRCVFDPPWSVRVRDRAPLTVLAMARGQGWLVPDDAEPVQLRERDVAIVRGPDPYTVADRPDTEPTMVIHQGQRSTSTTGDPLCETLDLGVRTWGNGSAESGSDVMIVGTYDVPGEISGRLLDALPPRVVISHETWDSPLVPLLATEIGRAEPGQEVVLDRLLDLLLIAALREWFARPESSAPAWYRAHSDPVVGAALRLLHANPAHPWTVAELAARAGTSRAALGRRFTALVGEPAMAYLTGWRLSMAADLLREPGNTVDAVARKVGYGSGFALSAAFKRVRGVSPRGYRDEAGEKILVGTNGGSGAGN
ncbi:AraC family transcriptional regulator [Saccharomonospora sp. NPDC006951]